MNSFDRVKKAITDKKEGCFDADKYKGIENDIWVLTEKLNRVKKMFPAAQGLSLSEDAEGLLKLVGKTRTVVGFSLKDAGAALKKTRKAASIL